MIRGISSASLALMFCLATMLSPGAAGAATREDSPGTARYRGEGIYAVDSDVPHGLVAQTARGGVAGDTVLAKVNSGKKAGKSQKFIDEDGDGYNDRKPEVSTGNAGGVSAGQSETKSGNVSGKENSGGQGLKKGQDNNSGVGIKGALERGIKKGQNSKNPQAGFSNSNQGNIKNNGNNKFDRNFEKYDRSSRGMKGEGSGRNE